MRGFPAAAFLAASLLLAAPARADAEGVVAALPVQDAVPPGPGLAQRLEVIRERIQAALVYPPLARLRGADGAARVRFEIDAAGGAREVRVVRSSGSPQLDAAAVRAVLAAGALPRVAGPLEVPVHFDLARGP